VVDAVALGDRPRELIAVDRAAVDEQRLRAAPDSPGLVDHLCDPLRGCIA
jgi:hypothetical protein